jgi:hypothetical protein
MGADPAMNADRWTKIKRLFSRAVDLPTADRRRVLEAASAATPSLIAQVEALIKQDSLCTETQAPTQRSFADGEMIAGRFRVINFIARGGMGEVYERNAAKLPVPRSDGCV